MPCRLRVKIEVVATRSLTCYLIVLMYAQGEYLFAILTLIWSAPGFTSSPTAAPMRRYVYPASPAWRCSSCSR